MYAFLYDIHGHLLMFDGSHGIPKSHRRTMGDLTIYCNYDLDDELWDELFVEAAQQVFDLCNKEE